MKQSKHEIELNFNSNQLYKIVLDIEKYPDYIPWCSKVLITKKTKNEIYANMVVNYKLFPAQEFSSNVFFDNEKLIIKTKYIKGPLKDLETEWEFIKYKENKTKVLFNVKFEFKNYLHQKLAEFFYPLIEKKMIKSFIERAEQILD